MNPRSLLAFLVLGSLALAAPVSLSGTVKTNLPQAGILRVGAFLTDRSGNPVREVGSSALNAGAFTLQIPDAPPPAALLSPVTKDSLDWPGLVGTITVTGQARVDSAVLRAYQDADRSGGNTSGDQVLETVVTRGRGNLAVVYTDARFRVQGDKGFDVTLEPGWNVIAIELGRTIEAKRVNSLDGLQLEVFGK
jgi:hypothetical protein